MRRHVWRLSVAVPALLAVALVGCYQSAAPPGAGGAAPASKSPAISTAPAGESQSAVPVTAVASAKLPEGMKAVVLSVPGMS